MTKTMIKYTKEIEEFIKENYETMKCKEMIEIIYKKFNLRLTLHGIYSFKSKKNLTSNTIWNKGTKGIMKSNSGSFKKGHIPTTKGTKGIMKPNSGSFKKGHIPNNRKPIGSERLNRDGYIELKISNPDKWKLKHRVVFEKHYGDIPKNMIVIFLDKNKTNCDKDNLELVTKREHLIMNKKGYYSTDPILTKASLNLIRLELRIIDKRKDSKDD